MCLLFQGLLEQIIVFDERQVWSKFCDVINERPCNVSYLICHLKIKNEEILDQFFMPIKILVPKNAYHLKENLLFYQKLILVLFIKNFIRLKTPPWPYTSLFNFIITYFILYFILTFLSLPFNRTSKRLLMVKF